MASTDRTREITLAAYRMIADEGLERFRIRSLADRVGINHATLLHYFPSKQAVIEAVVGYLLHQLRDEGMAHDAPTPEEALRHELDDFCRRLRDDRNFFVVLNELQLRGYRDARVAEPLNQMYTAWRRYLTEMINQGISAKQFRDDLPVEALVEVIISQFRGLTLSALDVPDDRMIEDTMAMLWTLLRRGIVRT